MEGEGWRADAESDAKCGGGEGVEAESWLRWWWTWCGLRAHFMEGWEEDIMSPPEELTAALNDLSRTMLVSTEFRYGCSSATGGTDGTVTGLRLVKGHECTE